MESSQVCSCSLMILGNDSYLSHVAWLCVSLVNIRKDDDGGWKEIKEHLSVISKVNFAEITELKTQLEAMSKPLPMNDPDENFGVSLVLIGAADIVRRSSIDYIMADESLQGLDRGAELVMNLGDEKQRVVEWEGLGWIVVRDAVDKNGGKCLRICCKDEIPVLNFEVSVECLLS
jgi:hypothetical protein